MSRTQFSPSCDTARDDCSLALYPAAPARTLADCKPLQFHCGKPPPAADPSTFMIIDFEMLERPPGRQNLGRFYFPGANKAAAADEAHRPPRRYLTAFVRPKSRPLDEVDLGRQVARNFETDFLLANSGFRPNLHSVSSKAVNCFQLASPAEGPPDWCRHLLCRPNLRIG